MAKKIAKKQTTKSKVEKTTAQASVSNDNLIWIIGLVLIVAGIFSFVSTLSHLFSWSADISAIQGGTTSDGGNLCGLVGAYIGYWLVDSTFGIFSLLIPMAMVFFGWRIILRRELHFNYLGLSVALLLVVGSTTIAYLADLIGSEFLWGGELGLSCVNFLIGWVKGFGLVLILVIAWILTGVFINSNLIGFINSLMTRMENKVEDLVSKYNKGEQIEDEQVVVERKTIATEDAADVPMQNKTVSRQPIRSVDEPLEDEITLVEPQPEKVEEPQPVEPQEDEDGFLLLVDGLPKKKDVNVDVLLDGSQPQVKEPQFDEDGFLIEDAQEQQAKPEQDPLGEVIEESADDEIIIKVQEPKHITLDEDEIVDDLYDPLMDLKSYHKPDIRLLKDYQSPHKVSDEEIYDNKRRIEETLNNFGIPIVEINATVGPTITLYEIVQAQGVKIAKIQGLEKDIAQSLKSLGIRIIAPIPGRGTIGIEVPNRDKQIVSMRSSICSQEFQGSDAQLPVVIGRTIQNKSYVFDLAKLPHLLVAGATGQGKSVGLNAIITSLLYSKHPAELKFVLIDPKMVEFPIYSKLERHFLAKMESEEDPIVTDPKRAVCVLNSLVIEMENRLQLCKMATTRNIVEYNEKFVERRLNPNKGHRFLPYIVVIIDEFADLIMTAKEVEVPVMRLAQKARAVGIHLIVATQRPDVKVITGGIKANFPSRIAFRVMQMVDSKTIIDQPGANQLIGRGDMLFSKDGELTRIQCALVETKEVTQLVNFIALQQGYTEAYMLPEYNAEGGGDGGYGGGNDSYDGESSKAVKYDPMYADIAREIVANGRFSISSIQQTHEVGFNRAARIVRQLERDGIVGPQIGSKPREIKYYDLPSLEAKLQELGLF